MSAATPSNPDDRQPPTARTTRQLVDLVLDPRDPAYEAAARRRGGAPSRRWYDRPIVVLGCLLAGFVLAAAYVHTNRGAPQAAKVHDSLVSRVRAAEQRGTDLADTLSQLDARLERLRSAALPGAQARALARDQDLAGQRPVTGPGLTVTLAEPAVPTATVAPGSAAPAPSNILSDRDVRSVVNQLWSDGAEAIAVNGVRLTATSAIRIAGSAVLVDLQPISSPYTIDAIGNPDGLATGFAESDVASRYQTLAGADGIGFHFDEQQDLQLPAAPGIVLRYAHPADGTSK